MICAVLIGFCSCAICAVLDYLVFPCYFDYLCVCAGLVLFTSLISFVFRFCWIWRFDVFVEFACFCVSLGCLLRLLVGVLWFELNCVFSFCGLM